MHTASLGSTHLAVSAVGLGLAALGRPGYINLGRERDLGSERSAVEMERRCHQVLDAAYALGVRYVDAARSYGYAERFLASWLTTRGLPLRAVTIGSKWGYSYTAAWRVDAPVHEVKDLSFSTLRRQLDESLELLDGNLRLLQIHSATLESGVLEDRRVLAELIRLRAEGLAIGLTVSGPRQADVIRRALQVRVDGVNPFQVVQATWNLLEVSAGPALAEAKAEGWGVIVKEVLANGFLSEAHVAPDTSEIRARADALGTTLDILAFAAALAQPWADVVLSGAVSREQLVRNLTAVDVVDAAREVPPRPMPPEEYWTRRRALPWG